jgi:alkaline phosphatase D
MHAGPPTPVDAVGRRRFLGNLSLITLSAAGCRSWRRPRFASSPFSLGIASGEPTPTGVVLWTRLAPDPLHGGGLPEERIEVDWQIARDDRLRQIVQRGRALAQPEFAHSVHVEVEGLEPDREYWYQFHVGNDSSPIGRTRTLPSTNQAIESISFAFVSCQHYEQGYYTSLDHLSREDVRFVIHLGDYIYEGPTDTNEVRQHVGGETETLVDYRNRYAQYKTDLFLQAAHATCPWIVTWDDHEVDNNYAGALSEHLDPTDLFLERRANAYQAYYEHMPLRRDLIPVGPDLRLYRTTVVGSLATFFVLDTRQYRTDQPCGDRIKPPCAGVSDPEATMMGGEQERWLRGQLDRSNARWNVLAQQVMMAAVDHAPGPAEMYSMDQWGGYEVPRTRLLKDLHERQVRNPIVLSGDIHSNWVNDLKTDFRDRSSPVVATEFVGTSLSSGGDGMAMSPRVQGMLTENPFVRYFNGQRGYVRCLVTPNSWRSDYRVVDYVTRPGAAISTAASFLVESGRPGAQPV